MSRRLLSTVVSLALALFLGSAGRIAAAPEDWLFDPFDGARLGWGDRRFVQVALALTGDYVGMLDGAWGRQSQEALERYASREYRTGYASSLEVGALMLDTIDEVTEAGWDYSYFETLDLSLLTPQKRMSAPSISQSGRFVDFSLVGGSLGYSMTIGDAPFTGRLHEFTLEEVAGQGAPYTIRKSRLLITSGETAAGKVFYTRSDWRANGWVTVMLSAAGEERALVSMVAGSIRNGRTPPLEIGEEGGLVRIVRATVAALEEAERNKDLPLPDAGPAVAGVSAPKGDETAREASSGTGFYVGAGGEVLSNAHVVAGCRTISVDGDPASLRALNEDFDLALIDTGKPRSDIAAFAAGPAALNSDVTVIGYPLSGLLGGVNVTRGAVSSLSGMGGDATRMQISAPVQPGNSGGPVVDRRGAVVGVVVSKLDALRMSRTTGDIPQNVNFAIRGEIAKLFLSLNGVEPAISAAAETLAPEALAARMTRIAAFVECR